MSAVDAPQSPAAAAAPTENERCVTSPHASPIRAPYRKIRRVVHGLVGVPNDDTYPHDEEDPQETSPLRAIPPAAAASAAAGAGDGAIAGEAAATLSKVGGKRKRVHQTATSVHRGIPQPIAAAAAGYTPRPLDMALPLQPPLPSVEQSLTDDLAAALRPDPVAWCEAGRAMAASRIMMAACTAEAHLEQSVKDNENDDPLASPPATIKARTVTPVKLKRYNLGKDHVHGDPLVRTILRMAAGGGSYQPLAFEMHDDDFDADEGDDGE